jgi:hypothetical protein
MVTASGQILSVGDMKSGDVLSALGFGPVPAKPTLRRTVARGGAATAVVDPTTLPLVQPGNLVYAGSFRLPASQGTQSTFAYGGTALAFNRVKGTLMAVGHAWYQWIAEVTVPNIATATAVSGLPRATYAQTLTDVMQGRLNQLGSGTVNIGGLLPTGSDLLISGYVYYDGSGLATKSHFRTKTDLTQAPTQLQGPFQLGNTEAGWVGGAMTPIPTEWQSALGGDALTGQCCIPVISRTSFGPSATVFNVADVGRVQPIPAVRVLGYPLPHPTLGDWPSSGALFNGTTHMGGMIFPNGTRTVLFAGRRGLGTFCYGEGTANNPPGIDSFGVPKCYDPTNASKGNHAYPYESFIWAYDVNDLVAVKQGRKNTWDVRPYATWPLTLPFANAGHLIEGIAYDPATQRVFISAAFGDGSQPVIHVMNLTNGSVGLCR